MMAVIQRSNIFHRGYCVKSPRIASHGWKRRWCSLAIAHIENIDTFYQSYDKNHQQQFKTYIQQERKSKYHLVFSYYETEKDEKDEKPIKQIVVCSSEVRILSVSVISFNIQTLTDLVS